MKMISLVGFLVGTSMLLGGCSEHDCEFANEDQKAALGEVAGMTKGANSCSASMQSAGLLGEPNLELNATHYEATVDKVTSQYETFLKGKGWEVEVKDHEGKRANGNPLEGKMVLAKKDGRNLGTIIYELTDGIVETTTMEVKEPKAPAE
jgi:hypothetical protein